MFDDLYAKEREASLGQILQRPPEPKQETGAFTGFGSALADSLPHAGLTAASAWSAVLDAFGNAQAYANAPTVAMMHGQPVPTKEQIERETIGQMGNSDAAQYFREKAKAFAPNPESVGTAGQIVHGLVSSLSKAVAYSASGPAAPVLFGADMGVNRAQELSDQGVDDWTAAQAGMVTGSTSALGMRLPPALGKTRLQSIAIGAGINPAMGIAERGTIHSLLEHADYNTIAQQYRPFDPTQIATEVLLGGAFGGLFHSPKVRADATLPPDEHAALLTMNEVRTRDGDTLTRPGDIVAANQAHDAQQMARGQIDSGEQVSVAHTINVEREQLDAAYQRVLDSPAGEALDPMVMIKPDDIDAVAISRGGWKGIGDVEVSGSGFGLVKFIWRHGEKSEKAPGVQIGRDDVLAFPQVARDYEPTVHQDGRGNEFREWRVALPGENGKDRTVVFVDKTMGDKGRHMVSLYVQEAGRNGHDAPLSQRKTDWVPESSGKWSDTHTGDTADGLLRHQGQDQSGTLNIAQRPGEAMPELAAAQSRLDAVPDMMIRLDDGSEIKAADALRQADEAIKQAEKEATGFQAAIACALRFPE